MTRRRPSLILGAYLSYGTGHHAAAWRHRESDVTATRNLDHYVRLARTAEGSAFDLIFLSDAPAVFNDDQAGFGGRVTSFEPLTLLSALAMVTSEIGLVATSSTTYKEPYNVAREYASLDLVSGGRAGWNLVTTSKVGASRNFSSAPHLGHAERYRRAEEFVDIVRSLWDSWDDDAYPADKSTGQYYDPSRRHRTAFAGEFFTVDAELNVPRPPQGHPLLVQAGSSSTGRNLAARTAEAVFTAQPRLDDAVAFCADLDRRTLQHQRVNPRILVMPGLTTYIGPTATAAQQCAEELAALVEPEFGLSMLSDLVGGFDLTGCDPDSALPDLPTSNANTSRRALIERMSRQDGLTLREIYQRMTTSRGHLTLIGSYDEVTDEIVRWFDAGGADGFNVMPPLFPSGLDEFVEHIVPRLRRRGIFKEKYTDGSLRDKLGLRRPPPTHHTYGEGN